MCRWKHQQGQGSKGQEGREVGKGPEDGLSKGGVDEVCGEAKVLHVKDVWLDTPPISWGRWQMVPVPQAAGREGLLPVHGCRVSQHLFQCGQVTLALCLGRHEPKTDRNTRQAQRHAPPVFVLERPA